MKTEPDESLKYNGKLIIHFSGHFMLNSPVSPLKVSAEFFFSSFYFNKSFWAGQVNPI